MGGNFWNCTTAWTFLCCLVLVVDGDRGLLQDLGLDALPDVTKINISQDEYTNMMNVYLRQLQDSSDATSIPKLFTFDSESQNWRRRKEDAIRLRFPIRPANSQVSLENAELRLLAPPLSTRKSANVQIYQVLGARRRRFIQEQEIFFSPSLNKWCEFDVTDVVRNWISGDRNLGLELECPGCSRSWAPLEATISALIRPGAGRKRRNIYEKGRRTDCVGNRKRKCCRHTMTVTFKNLKIPEMDSIIQPKYYEAGFCRGRCPLNYNHATNHSRIQSLMHRLDSKAMPKVCCAPSKLEPLEILRINPADTQKLMIEKWDNMKVVECACS